MYLIICRCKRDDFYTQQTKDYITEAYKESKLVSLCGGIRFISMPPKIKLNTSAKLNDKSYIFFTLQISA